MQRIISTKNKSSICNQHSPILKLKEMCKMHQLHCGIYKGLVLSLLLIMMAVSGWGQTGGATQSTAGNGTVLVPAGVLTLSVECTGAGGGGGGTLTYIWARGGGGAGGAYIKNITSVTAGTYNFTAGAGGGSGVAGGSSYFGNTSAGNPTGATVLSPGGANGSNASSAGTGNTAWSTAAAGTASTSGALPASGYTTLFAGTDGTAGTGTGNTSSSFSGTGGAGAASGGSGAGGAGGGAVSYSTAGSTGTAPGGGGGGGIQGSSSATPRVGGTGGAGKVVVTYYLVPTISNVNPNVGAASSNMNITVTGTNFYSGVSAITVDGVAVTTGYTNSTTLTATINVTAGSHTIGVTNTGTYGTSNSTSTVSFTGATDYYWGGGTNNTTGNWDNSATNWNSTGTGSPNAAWPSSGSYNANFNTTGGNATLNQSTIAIAPANTVLGTNVTFSTAGSQSATLTSPISLSANTLSLTPATTTNLTLSGNITSTGSPTTSISVNTGSGSGNVILSGTNSYTGATTVDGTGTGQLQIATVGALSASSAVTVTNGGGLRINVTGTHGNNSQTFTLTPNQTANPVIDCGNFAATLQGAISLGGSASAVRIEANGASSILTLSGNITGNNLLQKQAQGTLILSGTGNTYSGGTRIGNGTLTVNNGSSIGSGLLSLYNFSTTNILNLNNTAQTVSELSSNFQPTTGTFSNTINLGSGHTLTVNQSTNTTYGTGAVGTLTSVLAGSGGLTKSGTGTLTLSGANTYTGATSVNGGTLSVTGSLASGSAVSVGASGTLAGTGTVNGTVSVTGAISPAGSGVSGTLTTGANTWNNTGTYTCDITDLSSTNCDLISSTGTLTSSATFTINATLSGNAVTNFNGNTAYSWTIATFSAAPSVANLALNVSGISGYTGTFTLAVSGNNILVKYTPSYFWPGNDGTWGTSNAWRLGSIGGTSATWSNNNPAVLSGTAGTITVDANYTPSAIIVNSTGYTIASTTSTTFNLSAPITLANSVNLNLNSGTSSSGTLGIGSVTGGTSSGLTVTGNNTSASFATRIDLQGGATIAASAPITISTNGSQGLSGFVANGSSATSTINAAIANNTSVTTMLGATSGNTLTLGGVVSGSAGVQFSAGNTGGAGIVNINAVGTWTGATSFNGTTSGTVKLSSTNGISTASDITMGYSSTFGQTLDLNGFNQQFQSLASGSGTGSITNNATGNSTLTVNQSSNTTFGLNITDGSASKTIALTKSGAGTLTLSGSNNTFSGGVTINGGYLSASSETALFGNTTTNGITLNGGGIRSTSTINFNTANRTITLGSSGGYFDATNGTMTHTRPLSGSNTFYAVGGTNKMGAATVLPSGSTLDLANTSGCIVDLNAFSQTIAALTGGGTTGGNITNNGASNATLTVSNTTGSTTYAGVISDGSTNKVALTKSGASTLILTGNNTYTNATTISSSGGTLQIGNAGTTGAISTSSAISVGSSGTLRFNRSDNYGQTYSQNISGAGAVSLSGGTLTFSGTKSYTGGTTVNGGTLQLGAAQSLPTGNPGGGMTLNGGTLSSGVSTGFSCGTSSTVNMGVLTLSNTSTLNVGTGNHSLYFANSTAATWNGTLTIAGWGGTAGTTNTSGGKIFFGAASGTLTSAQLNSITFSGFTNSVGYLLSTGELVPVTAAPTLSAVTNQTVDNNFNITFTDNSTWRGAITKVNVDGTDYTNGGTTYYSTSTGTLTLITGTVTKLQTAGSHTIIVYSTGFTDASVIQTNLAGAAFQLAINTQPAAPASNGAVLATQPIIKIQDLYGNTTTSIATVTASVGAGSWTIGGTTAAAGVNGTATFTNLTATSAAAVTAATLTFSSGALTTATSNTFNITAPPPANDLCVNATTLTVGASATSGTTASATVTTPFSGNTDVWYNFTPTCSGTATVTIATTGQDIDLYGFTTSCPATTTASFTGSNGGGLTSETMSMAVTAGTIYYVRVVYYSATTNSFAGSFTIAITNTVTPQFTLANTGTPASSNRTVGTSNLALFGFGLTPSACTNSFDFTAASITTSGTVTSSDLSNFRLIVDANNDGIADAGEIAAPVGTLATLANPLVFSSISGQTGLSGTKRYLLIADIASGAVPARTFTASLTSVNTTASVSVTGSATGNAQTILGITPTLTAASGATVDGAFVVTFTENAAWRGAITSITVGGTTLSAGAYSTATAGQITFSPSASTLLQSAGSKAMVVFATGYANATITQSIGVGAASKLGITTQPAAPSTNGGTLATQPIATIQDQYGNTTTSTATVTATVGAGTWTIGGTTAVAGISGTATFTNLTAASAAAVTGATLTFTSIGLTSTTSSTFNIPGPDYISISSIGAAVSENFDGMSTSATATIPQGFKVSTAVGTPSAPTWTDVTNNTTATTVRGGTLAAASSGGIYNWANGDPTSATDRALGFLTSGNYPTTNGNANNTGLSILSKVRNNTSSTLSSMTISFDYDKYRNGTNPCSWTFFYSTDGSTWTSVTAGNQSYSADANNNLTTSAPVTTSKSTVITGLAVAAGADIYFRWSYSSGGTNAQGIGIDNFNVYGCSTPSVPTVSNLNTTYDGTSKSVTASVGSNTTVDWFDAANNGNLILSSTTTSPSNTNAGTYTYYAEARSTSGGCTNVSASRKTVNVTINLATPTISVTVGSFTYNGSSQGPSDVTGNTGNGTVTWSYVGVSGTSYGPSPSRPINAGSYTATASVAANGNYGAVSSGATAFTIDPKALTITGITAANKNYDGNATATLTGTASYSGLVNSESFNVSGTPSASFNDAAIGSGKAVTVTGYTAPNSNYSLTQPSFTASILALTDANCLRYRSKTTGNFSAITSWEYDQGDGTWVDAGHAPTSSKNIAIKNGHTITQDVDYTNGIGKTFTIESGGGYIIAPSYTLSIAGSADFGDQNVTIQSSVAGSGAIGTITGSLTNASNITVERYIPANGRKYRFLASPVVGGTSLQWRDNAGSASGRGIAITGPSGTVDASQNNQSSAYWYNETSTSGANTIDSRWTAIDGNASLTNGLGYRVFVRGDRSIPLTSANTTNNPTTVWVNGAYPSSPVTIPVSYTATTSPTSGWNLIGNPLPCTIDWSAVVAQGASNFQNISSSVYVWNPSNNATTTGGYESYVGGVSSIGGGNVHYISSGQAFFIKATGSGTPVLKIGEAQKINHQGQKLFKNGSLKPNSMRLNLYADTLNIDNTVLYFDDAATRNFDDAYDAYDLTNNIGVLTQDGKTTMAIAGNPFPAANETIKLSAAIATGSYKIKFTDLSSFTTLPEAYLVDKFMNKTTKLADNATYAFTADANNPLSIGNERFELKFTSLANAVAELNKSAHQIKLYPNPAETEINLYSLQNNNEPKYFSIFNEVGQEILQGSLDFNQNNNQKVNIETLADGVYFIRIIDNQGTQIIRFAK